MDNLNKTGLTELNKKEMEDTNGGVKIGIGFDLALDLENPFGISGILESILGNVDVGAGGDVGAGS